jgi:lipid A 4'-phosphatase
MSVGVAAISKAQSQWRLHAWRSCLPITVGLAAILVAFPEIDLWIAQATFTPGAGFVGARLGWLGPIRAGFIVFYFSCLVLSILFCWLASRRRERRFLTTKEWFFVIACLSVGPGLLANVGFKDQWGRARPRHIIAFGGSKQFTPALLPTNQCKHNCSFVSGEASSVFAPFFAAAAVVPQWTATLIIAGSVAGLGAGVVRVLQGAHFLSDVLFAGLFMGLTVLALQRLLFGAAGAWLRQQTRRWTPRPPAAAGLAATGSQGQRLANAPAMLPAYHCRAASQPG